MKSKKSIIVGIVLVLLALIFAIFFYFMKLSSDKNKTAKVYFNVSIDESWNKDSTPLIVHIKGTEKNTNSVDEYKFISYDDVESKKVEDFSLPIGGYDVTYISPMNDNGNIYSIKEEVIHTEKVNVDSQKEELKLDVEYKAIPEDKTKSEDIDKILEEIIKIPPEKFKDIKKDDFEKLVEMLKKRITDLKSKEEMRKKSTEIDEIIKKSKSEGKDIYIGNLKIFRNDEDMLKFQNMKNPNPGTSDEGPFIILDFEKKVKVSAFSVTVGATFRETNYICLSRGERVKLDYWEKYAGKKVIVAVKDGYWPSDTSLPLGIAAFEEAEVIYEGDIPEDYLSNDISHNSTDNNSTDSNSKDKKVVKKDDNEKTDFDKAIDILKTSNAIKNIKKLTFIENEKSDGTKGYEEIDGKKCISIQVRSKTEANTSSFVGNYAVDLETEQVYEYDALSDTWNKIR